MGRYSVLSSTGSKKPRLFYGYVVALVGFLVLTIMWVPTTCFGVFLKPLSSDFGWTRAMTSGAYSFSFLLFGLSSIVMGRLNDRFGPRLVVTGCGLFLVVGYLLMWQISTFWQLYLFYGLMVGMGSGGSFVPVASTVARWFVKRRGLMTSLVLSGIGASTAIGAPVAGWLISSYGWRTSYFVLGAFTLLFLILITQFLKRDPSKIGQLPYGQSELSQGGTVLEARESSAQGAIRTSQFWMLCLTYACIGVSILAIVVHLVPHATDLGISTITASNILAVSGGLVIAGRIGMGNVADKIGNKRALVISLILLSASLLWLQLAKELWMLYLFAVIFGFGFGGTGMLMSSVVAELFGLRAHGAILGMVNFGWTIGGAVGPLLAGYLFDVAGSYYLVFMICAVLSIAGLIVASLLKPIASLNLA